MQKTTKCGLKHMKILQISAGGFTPDPIQIYFDSSKIYLPTSVVFKTPKQLHIQENTGFRLDLVPGRTHPLQILGANFYAKPVQRCTNFNAQKLQPRRRTFLKKYENSITRIASSSYYCSRMIARVKSVKIFRVI